MSKQPEALRLADALEKDTWPTLEEQHKAAAELRRLVAEVEEQCRLNGMGSEREAKLMAENKALRDQRDALIEALKNIERNTYDAMTAALVRVAIAKAEENT